MAGYSKKENVRRVIVVGVATEDSKGNAAIYTENRSAKAIPEDSDWSGLNKELRVKPAIYFTDAEDLSQLHFNVKIPKHFFKDDKLVASPAYKKDDVLHAKLTGHGTEAGYIDLNVEGRGAGGNTVVTEEGCAKWS